MCLTVHTVYQYTTYQGPRLWWFDYSQATITRLTKRISRSRLIVHSLASDVLVYRYLSIGATKQLINEIENTSSNNKNMIKNEKSETTKTNEVYTCKTANMNK